MHWVAPFYTTILTQHDRENKQLKEENEKLKKENEQLRKKMNNKEKIT